MKKLYYLIVLALILGLVLTGCFLTNVGQVPATEQSGITYLTKHTEDTPLVIDLIAGQYEDIGDVLVWNDADTLYVKFVYEGTDCGFLEVHLQVDEGSFSEDILTKKGNPIPGKFEKSFDVGCFTEHTFTYNLADEGFEGNDELVIAAHAALGIEDTMTFESNVGDTVYGPINSDNMPTDWSSSVFAVRAYNWLGYTRDLTNPEQIPGCTTNPYSSLTWSWGFNLNPTYSPDIPGVLWISTAPNTEEWHVDSWRKFVENYEVPGYPIAGSLQVNADNYYVVSNGVLIGSDDNIFNGPETYTFYPDEGLNILEFITENWAQGSAGNYCSQLANPNGITYKGTISYYADGETAWGCGNDSAEPNCHEFLGKNWATYFRYTVPLDQIEVFAVSSTPVEIDLNIGNYKFVVSGTAFAGDTIDFDAKYSITNRITNDTWTDIVSGYASYGPDLLDLQVNGASVDWGLYNEEHIYEYLLIGWTGGAVTFCIYDIYPINNLGHLIVEIYEQP